MKIKNKEELDKWFNIRRRLGRDCVSVKGKVEGATYPDGEPITHLINIGWKDCVTGEIINIEYEI